MITIGVAMPVYDGVTNEVFGAVGDLFAGWAAIMPPDWKLRPMYRRGTPVDLNREWLAAAMLVDIGPDLEGTPLTGRAADIILWQDSDCYLEAPLDYYRLIQALVDAPPQVGAIAAAFPIQGAADRVNFMPLERDGRRTFSFDGSIQEVAWCGFGCIATRASVFRAMPRPWFKFTAQPFELTADDVRKCAPPPVEGEDAYWCRRAAEAGFVTMVHSGMVGRHDFRSPRSIREMPRPARGEESSC